MVTRRKIEKWLKFVCPSTGRLALDLERGAVSRRALTEFVVRLRRLADEIEEELQ